MKTILALLLVALVSTASAAEPKRPLGVPATAKHFNGRWYQVYLEKKSWHAARDKCKDLGGQLCTVPDSATWEFVRGLTTASVWLGATDETTEGVWKWVDGSDVAFTKWIGGRHDNAGGVENYLCTHRGEWNDAAKHGKFDSFQVVGFICEWR